MNPLTLAVCLPPIEGYRWMVNASVVCWCCASLKGDITDNSVGCACATVGKKLSSGVSGCEKGTRSRVGVTCDLAAMQDSEPPTACVTVPSTPHGSRRRNAAPTRSTTATSTTAVEASRCVPRGCTTSLRFTNTLDRSLVRSTRWIVLIPTETTLRVTSAGRLSTSNGTTGKVIIPASLAAENWF